MGLRNETIMCFKHIENDDLGRGEILEMRYQQIGFYRSLRASSMVYFAILSSSISPFDNGPKLFRCLNHRSVIAEQS